jgi:hypothetical protein
MIGKWIYSKLTDDAAIAALVDDRVYPIGREEESTLPAVVYSLSTSQPIHAKKEAATTIVWTCELDCFAENYDDAWELAGAVSSCVDRTPETLEGIEIEDVYIDSISDTPLNINEISIVTVSITLRHKL